MQITIQLQRKSCSILYFFTQVLHNIILLTIFALNSHHPTTIRQIQVLKLSCTNFLQSFAFIILNTA